MLEIAIDPTVLTPAPTTTCSRTRSVPAARSWPATPAGRSRASTSTPTTGSGPPTWTPGGPGVSVTKAADPGRRALGPAQRAPSQPQIQASARSADAVGGYVNPSAPRRASRPGGSTWASTTPAPARSSRMGAGTVTYSQPSNAGSGPYSCTGGYGGAVVYRLSGGADRGRYVYVAEGIIPTVTAGQPPAARAAGRDVHRLHRDRLGIRLTAISPSSGNRPGVPERRRRLPLHRLRSEHEPADPRARRTRRHPPRPGGPVGNRY